MNYREAIDWLFSTQLFGIKLGLEGSQRLLKEFLAYPSRRTRVLHVAGTNGKGSTCAMAESVARAGGTRTGLFTSPHLIDFRERIRVMGVEIPEEECAALLTELRDVCGSLDPHPTFFEITLAAAMRWFRERECELVILETGMGGRLDATTAVPADVCGITPIGMDHMQWLGETLGEIAFEKAGILVEGKPVFSAPQEPEARRVLEKEANQRRSPLRFVSEPLRGYPIGLRGEHQAWNAALALDCLHALGERMDSETVRHGLETVSWPGRFEVIDHDGVEFVLDGAHNIQGAKALVDTWKSRYGERKGVLVFSSVESKDVGGSAQHLEGIASEVHVCVLDSPRALSIDELAGHFTGATGHAGVAAALSAASSHGGPVLVAGSLFLIGETREILLGGSRMRSAQ